MNKGLIAVAAVIIVVLVVAGAWVVMQPAQNTTNNTTNITNNTTQNQTHNQTRNQTHVNNTNITAAQANKLAEKYTGMGVYLGNNTVLTTYKGVTVWNVSVYTTQGLYTDSIYINANTGDRIQ